MVALEHSIVRIREWTAEFEHGPPPQLDKKWVHKHQLENAFVSRVEPIGEGHPDDFVAQLFLDSSHSFFFEHPLDHYPGLMLVEAGRQLGTAVAHIEYNVPLDAVFILNGLNIDFSSFAELDQPVFVNSSVTEKEMRRGSLVAMLYSGHFIQNETEIGFMSGRWHMYSKRTMQRMRRAALSGAAVPGASRPAANS